jgi:hypothetical protein
LRPSHALEAAGASDKVESIVRDGFHVNAHSKLITKANPSFCLLVLETVNGAEAKIFSAFKVYTDLSQDVGGLSPLQMLEQIAERFGDAVEVGDRKDKFIWDARIPISGPSAIPLMHGLARLDHSVAASMFVKINPGPPMFADCALCYCIRTDAYKAWLKKH